MTAEDRLGPPPVDPMSDVAWARVERGLMGRLDTSTSTQIQAAPPNRRWLWIAAPLVAAAAVIALVIGLRGGDSQQVAITPPAPTPDEPTRIVSGDAPTTATFGDDAHITLDANSAIAMTREANQPTTVLERGAARFAVTPRKGQPPFIVRAGDTTVRVVGTQFRVARYEERVTVAVERGTIEVQFRGTLVSVHDQQTWTSERPGEVADVVVKTAVVVPATPPRKQPPSKKVTREPAKATITIEPAKAEPTADADQAKFERLQAIERKDPQAAIAGYLELSQRSPKWAMIGLFAAASLAEYIGDARAETLLTIYLRRFPNTKNAKDAQQALDRIKGAPK